MINSFKQYIVEDVKTLYFTFGRMNPPTIGHEKLLEVLAAKSGPNPYRVYLSHTNDKKKNPLVYSDKVKYARKMMPKHARYIMMNKEVKTVFDAANAIYNEGFVNIVMVVGSDRISEFKTLLTKYNGKTGQRYGFYNFRTIDVISAGERDPDSEGVDGMSASKMRAAASGNDFNQFTKGLPKNFSNKDSKDLFNGVRSGMGLKEETEFYKHVQLESVGDLREKYIQGEIYNLGERLRIKDTDELAEVTFRGPNYLILEKEDGSIVRKWIEAVESLDESVKKVPEPKWKKSGPNGEKEITFSTGRRFQIEKQLDQNERHKGEWKVMEWNKRSRDWDWHETYSPQWHAKKMVMELGKYDSKGKKVAESIESVNEDPVQLAHDASVAFNVVAGMGAITYGANKTSNYLRKKIGSAVRSVKANHKRNKPVFVEPIARPRTMRTINNENKELDNYNKTGWGTKETTKRWVNSTPGQDMPDVKSTPKSKTRNTKMRHPGADASDAGGMGEGAMKRSGPDMDGYSAGGNKATISYDKIDKGLRTYRKKPDDLITKIKIARKGAKLILGDKRDGK